MANQDGGNKTDGKGVWHAIVSGLHLVADKAVAFVKADPQRFALLTILLLLLASASGLLDQVIGLLGKRRLDTVNGAWLAATGDRILATLMVLSGIKSALEVINSAGAGLSILGLHLSVTIGKAFQPGMQALDSAWSMTLGGAAATAGLGILNQLAISLCKPLMTAMLACLLGVRLMQRYWRHGKAGIKTLSFLFKVLLIATIGVYLLMPAGLYVSYLVSDKLIAGVVTVVPEELTDLRNRLEPAKKTIAAAQMTAAAEVASSTKGTSLEGKFKDAVKILKVLESDATSLMERLIKLSYRLLVVHLLQRIVAPIALMYGLYKLARRGIDILIERVEEEVKQGLDVLEQRVEAFSIAGDDRPEPPDEEGHTQADANTASDETPKPDKPTAESEHATAPVPRSIGHIS